LIAHVLERSPAAEAGVRNGDVLLKIGERDVTGWRTDKNRGQMKDASQSPAGTKMELTLLRDSKEIKITAVLRDILVSRPPNL